MDVVIDLLLTVHIAVSLLLVLVVLMQRPRSEGLGTAFASGMVEQYIGPATGVLVRFTTWLGGTFFVLTVLLAILYSHRATAHSRIGERLLQVPAVKATPTPIPSPAKAVPPVAGALPGLAPAPSAAPSVAPPAPSAAAVATPSGDAAATPAAALPEASVAPAPTAAPVATPVPTASASPARTPAARKH